MSQHMNSIMQKYAKDQQQVQTYQIYSLHYLQELRRFQLVQVWRSAYLTRRVSYSRARMSPTIIIEEPWL